MFEKAEDQPSQRAYTAEERTNDSFTYAVPSRIPNGGSEHSDKTRSCGFHNLLMFNNVHCLRTFSHVNVL